MEEDIDMSLLMPIGSDGDRGQDDIVAQILDGRYALLPEQRARLQNLIDSQCHSPSDKEVTISEEDLLGIISATGDVTDTDIDDILNTNSTSTINTHQDSNDVLTEFLSDPINNTASASDFQEFISSPTVTTNTVLPTSSNQPCHGITQHNETLSTVNLKSANTLAAHVPVQTSSPQVSKPPTTAKLKPGIPLTINLPPDLPAGRYLMKHSVTDPSMLELSFPGNPSLKPLMVPLGPTPINPSSQVKQGSGVRMRGAMPQLDNPGRGPRMRGAVPQAVFLRPNQPCAPPVQSPRTIVMMPKMTASSAIYHQQSNTLVGMVVRPIGKSMATSTNAPVRAIPPAKNPVPPYRSLLRFDPPISNVFSSRSQRMAGGSQSGPVFSAPISQTFTNASGCINYPIPSVKVPPSPSVSVTSASEADCLHLGAPVQLNTGSNEPIRTPIKLGNVTYLPVGFPVQVSDSLKQGRATLTPMVNVANISGGLAMTGINTAIQIDSAAKVQPSVPELEKNEKGKTELVKQVQLVGTADSLRTKEVVRISPVVSDVQPLVQIKNPPAPKITPITPDPLNDIGNRVTENASIANSQGLKPSGTGIPHSMMSKGVINHKGKLVLTEVVTMANKASTLNSQQAEGLPAAVVQQTESNALPSISGLINFALCKTQHSTPITLVPNQVHYTKPPKPRKIYSRSSTAHLSLNHPIQVHSLPSKGIEGQQYGPKYILDDGLVDLQTVEICEQPITLTSMRIREQSHKMVSVTIRDNCINFKNEAGAMADLQLKHLMMKAASDHTRKDVLEDITNTVVDEKSEENQTGDGRYAQSIATQKLHIADAQTANVRENKNAYDGNTVCVSTPREKLLEILTEPQADVNAVPDEVLAIEEKAFECERLKGYYRRYVVEQRKREEDMTSKLDGLVESSTSREHSLSRLFQGVPQFVDDPLIGDSNAPMYFCCYLCPFASFNEAKVCVHWTLVHLKQNPYMCGYCSARFNSSGKVHRHLLLAHPVKKVLIKMISSELFANTVQFEFIQEDEENSNTLCPMIEVGPKHELKAHWRKFACKECTFTTVKEGTMMQHVRKTHFNLYPYTCGYCEQKFRHSALIDSHMNMAHPILEKYIMEDTQLTMLQERLKLKDFYSIIPNNRPVIFEPNSEYWRHEENKLDRQKKRFSCMLCTFFTKRLEVIWKHVRMEHHLPEGVHCRRCLCYHRLLEIEREKEFFVCYSCCTLCSLRLDKVWPCVQLRQVFLCLKCKEQLEDLNAMKKHIKSRHIDVYPYSCMSCKLKFVMKQAALNHAMETHGTVSVIKKQTSLLARMARRVRKLHIKYMYVEPQDEDGELSALWVEYGLKIVRAADDRIEAEVNATSNLPDDLELINVDDDEGGVSIVTNVDQSHKPDTSGPTKTMEKIEFSGTHHYRCQLCPYKCLDRSCMARHVKYMHLRIHPHSCPFCGYSNVEKTKVKIHISNLHNKSEKKVRTNTTLVTALGEESKKHFVRVFPNGREISQIDTGLSRLHGGKRRRGIKQKNLVKEHGDKEGTLKEHLIDVPDIKLEPLDNDALYGQLADNVDDEHIRQLDQELKALQWEAPLGQLMLKKELVNFDHDGQEVLDVDMGSCDEPHSANMSPSKQRSILYDMLMEPKAPQGKSCTGSGLGHKRRAAQTPQPPAKRHKKANHIYPYSSAIMADPMLRMLPIVILHDVLEDMLAGY